MIKNTEMLLGECNNVKDLLLQGIVPIRIHQSLGRLQGPPTNRKALGSANQMEGSTDSASGEALPNRPRSPPGVRGPQP